MKSKIMTFIFSLLTAWFILCPTISYADEAQCSTDEIEEAEGRAQNLAKKNIDAFLSTVGPFNTAAQNYISKCNKPAWNRDKDGKIARYVPNNSVAARAALLGKNSFKNSGNFENLNYNWSQTTPPNANCSKMLKTVKDTMEVYKKALNLAETTTLNSMNKSYIMCLCGKQGTDTGCVSAESQAAQGAGACKTFPEYQEELNKCPLCGIFEVILKTIAGVSSKAWNAVAQPLSNVVMIFFLVLLAFEVLKAVSAVAGSKISALAKGVLVLCLKIAITIQLLSTPKYIYGYFLSPVIEGGLNMGLAMANASGAPGANCAVSPDDKVQVHSDTFSPSVYDTVLSTVRCFGVAASTLPAIGRGLTCYAWDAGHLGFPHLGMWLSGVLMYVFGLMIWLAISFYMIDCTVQIGMLSGLVPLLIACWPFKFTEAYAFKGCKMLMNSFFSYVMMGVILLLGTMITTHAATGDGSNIEQIVAAINDNDIKALKKMCSLDAFQILILASCCIFAMKLIGQVNNLADQFSKGSGSSIGNKMGGMAMSAATSAGKKAFNTAGRIAGSTVKHTAAATGVTAALNKGGDAIKGGWQKGWAKMGQAAKLGKYQNKQTGSGKDGEDNKQEDKEDNKQDTQTPDTPTPDTPTPDTQTPDNQTQDNPQQ